MWRSLRLRAALARPAQANFAQLLDSHSHSRVESSWEKRESCCRACAQSGGVIELMPRKCSAA
eukprot:8868965-Heterocapsa_arctica.AAC.1